MKKFYLFICALWLATSSLWAYDFEVDGIYYDYNEEGTTVSVTHKNNRPGYSGTVSIPESVTYEGTTYSVTAIGEYAFEDCTELTSITIPESVTTIETYAFYVCENLTSITIPESVTTIGEYAFYECKNLTSITFPDNITEIGSGAFDYTPWYDDQPI